MNLLIVEDNKEVLASLKDSLEDQGFVVDTAEDGADGLYKAKITDYDLIVLDVGLPKKDGKQVCMELRNCQKNMPIIMLSVQGDIATKAELLEIGADDYIVKPFSFIELFARIKACLRRPREIKNKICRIESIAIDSNARTVMAGDKEIHLTPKEFFLLEYLMRHRGRVISRQEILEHVWGDGADLFTNTIEAHVANIRAKLKGKVKKDFIQTVSNGGYKII